MSVVFVNSHLISYSSIGLKRGNGDGREGTTHVRAQHNRRLLRRRHRNHLKIPRHVAQSVRNIADHLTGKALITIRIRQAERDAVARVRHNRPVPPIPAIRAAVQGICSSRCLCRRILVGKNMIRRPIDREGAVLDAVCVASWHAAEMRMLAVLLRSTPLSHTRRLFFEFPGLGGLTIE